MSVFGPISNAATLGAGSELARTCASVGFTAAVPNAAVSSGQWRFEVTVRVAPWETIHALGNKCPAEMAVGWSNDDLKSGEPAVLRWRPTSMTTASDELPWPSWRLRSRFSSPNPRFCTNLKPRRPPERRLDGVDSRISPRHNFNQQASCRSTGSTRCLAAQAVSLSEATACCAALRGARATASSA